MPIGVASPNLGFNMKFHYVPVALLLVASMHALGASSGSVEGRISFSLTDLRPDDPHSPSITVQGPLTYVDASLWGQPSRYIRPGVVQGPFGAARAEVFGDWQFKALGFETGVGYPSSEGTAFSARAVYYVPGTGMTISPQSMLTLTGTFSGNILVEPSPRADSSAYVWASLLLHSNAIPGGGLDEQRSEAFVSEQLDQPTFGEKSFTQRVITVSITNPTDFELRLHYSASVNVGGVSPVPEPSTWIMGLVGGFALLGHISRRKRAR